MTVFKCVFTLGSAFLHLYLVLFKYLVYNTVMQTVIILYKPEDFLLLDEYNTPPKKHFENLVAQINSDIDAKKESSVFYIYTEQKKYLEEAISKKCNFISKEVCKNIMQNTETVECSLYYFAENKNTDSYFKNEYNSQWRIKSFFIKDDKVILDEPIWLKNQNSDFYVDKGIYKTKDNSFLCISKEVLDLINGMVNIRKPIFVIGERGSGKTTIIQDYIKETMELPDEKFVSVACGTLEPERAKYDLFGYVKGAYTDAKADFVGYIEKANGGCLYLDEVQDLKKDVQRELIKCIEEHVFCKVGSTKIERSDFLLICSSNKSLSELKKVMYDDFFDRINTFQIKIKSIEEQKAENKNFISNCLESVWNNYVKTASKQSAFPSYEKIDKYNSVPGKTIKEKIITALNDVKLNGNYRDIEKLLSYIELYALNRTKFESLGINDIIAVNKNIDIGIEKWKEFLNERDSVIPELTTEFIEKQKWEGINNMFRKWVANRAVETYGSPTAAAKALGVDKNSIIRVIKKTEC